MECKMQNTVTALVTVYQPDETVVKNIANIAKQVNRIVVCDNSSEDHRNIFLGLDGSINYITCHINQGLPGAFNLALRSNDLHWNEEEFIIFFDQDSQIKEGYIQGLLHSYLEVENNFPELGCMGPVFYNTSNDSVEIPRIKTKLIENNYKVDNVITSSMIMRYKNLKKINFWNDNLFLDFADWDLCWRLKKAGMICVITEEVILHHSVGSGQKKIGPIHLRVGAPFREYYQTRDALYLLQEKYVPLKMRLRLIGNVTIRPIFHYAFLDDKDKRLEYIKQGKRDFKKKIHGELVINNIL